MLKIVALTALAVLAFASPAWASSSLGPKDMGPELVDPRIRDVQAGYDRLAARDYVGARTLFLGVVSSPTFNSLGGEQCHAALLGLGAAQFNSGQYKQALATMKTAVAYDEADGQDWNILIRAAVVLNDTTEAIACLTASAERWPGVLSNLDDRAIYILTSRKGARTNEEDRFHLLAALYAARWKPNDVFKTTDDLWSDLILAYLNRGQVAKAKSIAPEISTPSTLTAMMVDRRYDPVTADMPQTRDIAGAIDRELSRLRALAADHPDKLAGVAALSRALVARDQPQEALDLVDAALARIPVDESAKSPYTDLDQKNWLLEQRARTLLRLGRIDEAIAALRVGAQTAEYGRPNVSQTLNLGDELDIVDRPKEALDAIKTIKESDVSPYGALVAAQVRTCSYAQLHDAARTSDAAAYTKAHAADFPDFVVSISVCTRDLDLAARALIDELNDPRWRNEALGLVQDWRQPRFEPRREREDAQFIRQLRERPDVRAVIDRVGRVESFPIG